MLITLPDYRRIYSTIHSLLISDRVASHEASLLFSVYGAQILKRHYGVAAQPMVGTAAFHLGLQAKLLTFGAVQTGQLASNESNYHCWVEADGWIIDFMAPLYPQLVKRAGLSTNIAPWMWQKQLSKAKQSLADVQMQGDYFISENDDLGGQKLSEMLTQSAHIKRGKLAIDWFVRPPKKMPSPLNVSLDGGKKLLVPYSSYLVSGAW